MKITNISIAVLSILDITLVVFVLLLDKWQWYRNASKPASQRFFCNTVYDEPVNRFMLSKGGLIILALGFITISIINKSITELLSDSGSTEYMENSDPMTNQFRGELTI